MLKVQGVESVHVSLKEASTTIELRAGNVVTLDQVRDIIKKNGFKPGAAQVRATGTLVDVSGRLRIDLAPAKVILSVASEKDAAAEEARKLLAAGDRVVEVAGTVSEGQVLTLREIKRGS